MADSTVTLYRTLIPAHAAVPQATVSAFLLQASLQHSAAVWGALFESGMVYYAAHMLEKTPGLGSAMPGEVAPITGQTDGAVSRQYQTPAILDPDARSRWLSTTVYGLQYLAIRSGLAEGKPVFVGAELY